jgi:hypothetical protein
LIKKLGNKYLVLDKSGKRILGKHDTKQAAIMQLKVIEMKSRKRGG